MAEAGAARRFTFPPSHRTRKVGAENAAGYGFRAIPRRIVEPAGRGRARLGLSRHVRQTEAGGGGMKFFDDMQIGDRREIGKHLFTAEEIKRFARSFDPQPFHMDEEAARRSHFGALCASGWHTTAA